LFLGDVSLAILTKQDHVVILEGGARPKAASSFVTSAPMVNASRSETPRRV